jgi:hypothetical protein
LPTRLRAEVIREIEVIELLMRQIVEVEAERDAIEPQCQDAPIAWLGPVDGISAMQI